MRQNKAYAEAAKKYAPVRTGVLFVAEAPPNRIDRYFYFEDVKQGDWLWIALMKALFPSEWGSTTEERQRKRYWLQKFQENKFRLIDAVKVPISGTDRRRIMLIRAAAPGLIKEIRQIDPEHIILIKETVYNALVQRLAQAELPVVNREFLPFPCSGWQTEFHEQLRKLIHAEKIRNADQPAV